jgi:hypothetical protein
MGALPEVWRCCKARGGRISFRDLRPTSNAAAAAKIGNPEGCFLHFVIGSKSQRKGCMKKLMIVVAVAGLVAGCAGNRNAGGTSNQNQMNSGSESGRAGTSSMPAPGTSTGTTWQSNSNGVSNSPQQ